MKNNFFSQFKNHLSARGETPVVRDWSFILVVALGLGLIVVGWRLFHFWSWEQQLSPVGSSAITHQLNESRLTQVEAKLKARATRLDEILTFPSPVKDPSI
ncbi:MAG: hypothetical protein Q7T49_02075 [bacterium]|nr:hypothetical protein [bacterium]